MNTEKQGFVMERKIPLVTIKSIAMSSLRDDWMVRVEKGFKPSTQTHCEGA